MLSSPDQPGRPLDGEHRYQDLRRSKSPAGYRGRSQAFVQLWWLVQSLLMHPSPQVLYGWRRFLLRAFGAKIGRGVLIRPTVRVTYPWKVVIGDYCQIGDRAELYSLGPITIGRDSVVSQDSYICTGTHDHTDPTFPLVIDPIVIEDEAWVAAGAFVGPGVTIGRGAIVGARSVVFKDIPPGQIAVGQPARLVGDRRRRPVDDQPIS